jgi:TRAP-type C4-dicarboxylate transport system substrate-binding protein
MWGRLASVLVLAALGAAAAAGCGGGGSGDRAGGHSQGRRVVLTLASATNAGEAREWIAAVRRLSGGSLKIAVKPDWRHGSPGYDRDALADVRAGRVDTAIVDVRVFDTLGVKTFQGLMAPFLVDSYALERGVLEGPLVARMLAGAKAIGVGGVALLPGGLQRILSIGTPMLDPDDYRAQPIGVAPSALADATLHALGAPVEHSEDPNRLFGLEQDLVSIVAARRQRLTAGETVPANVVFWPRGFAIVIAPKAEAALSDDQRALLREAARAAVAPAIQRLVHDERVALHAICSPPSGTLQSFSFLRATPSDLAALRAAVRPVYAQLERDPTARAVVASVDAAKRTRGAAPQPRCGARLPRSAGGALRVSGALTEADHETWRGAVHSARLGDGQLVLKRHFLFRSRLLRRSIAMEARFAGGVLRGCVNLAVDPTAPGVYRLDGPGAVRTASGSLRRYLHASWRFSGSVKGGDLRHMHAGFTTDAPTGQPCDPAAGV